MRKPRFLGTEQKSEQRKKAFQHLLECLFYIYYSFVSFAYRRIKL
ncbi:lipoyl synthase [Prevotella intermedia ZT]|uniref:Lipoyl synthase n=1 Tax=Prevotella intermedia ZT TaxID=1347790 RepID=A0AAP0YYW2_PREIN|nr:lipoyl synthase [Prevotella intermedia ZT]